MRRRTSRMIIASGSRMIIASGRRKTTIQTRIRATPCSAPAAPRPLRAAPPSRHPPTSWAGPARRVRLTVIVEKSARFSRNWMRPIGLDLLFQTAQLLVDRQRLFHGPGLVESCARDRPSLPDSRAGPVGPRTLGHVFAAAVGAPYFYRHFLDAVHGSSAVDRHADGYRSGERSWPLW